jgi:hypothetical protein
MPKILRSPPLTRSQATKDNSKKSEFKASSSTRKGTLETRAHDERVMNAQEVQREEANPTSSAQELDLNTEDKSAPSVPMQSPPPRIGGSYSVDMERRVEELQADVANLTDMFKQFMNNLMQQTPRPPTSPLAHGVHGLEIQHTPKVWSPQGSLRHPSPIGRLSPTPSTVSTSASASARGNRAFIDGAIKDLGTFNGESNATKLQTFIDKIDTIMKHQMITPDTVVDFVTMKFTGLASQWWRSLSPDRRRLLQTWEDVEDINGPIGIGLRSALLARFMPKNFGEDVLRKLRELKPPKMGKPHSMDEFIADFNILVILYRIYPTSYLRTIS